MLELDPAWSHVSRLRYQWLLVHSGPSQEPDMALGFSSCCLSLSPPLLLRSDFHIVRLPPPDACTGVSGGRGGPRSVALTLPFCTLEGKCLESDGVSVWMGE